LKQQITNQIAINNLSEQIQDNQDRMGYKPNVIGFDTGLHVSSKINKVLEPALKGTQAMKQQPTQTSYSVGSQKDTNPLLTSKIPTRSYSTSSIIGTTTGTTVFNDNLNTVGGAPQFDMKELLRKKVPELKNILTDKGMKTTGNKPDLIHAILDNQKSHQTGSTSSRQGTPRPKSANPMIREPYM
jgi:hypothetical protein